MQNQKMSRPVCRSNALANHGVFIQQNGSVTVTGNNSQGQLGLGHTTQINTATAVTLPDGKSAMMTATGPAHTAIIMNDGSLYMSGDNTHGELGLGITTQYTTLTNVPITRPVRDVAFGSIHSAIVTIDGALYTTGNGGDGRLGLGNTNSHTSYQQVYPSAAAAVACGIDYTLVLTNDGDVYAFGNNTYGQLGVGNTDSYSSPQYVLSGAKAIYCSEYTSFAVMQDNTMRAWGYNGSGYSYTGTGVNDLNILTPTAVSLPVGKTIKAFSVSQSAALVLFTDNSVYGWGTNTNNVLGNLTLNAEYTTPTALDPFGGPTHTIYNIVSFSFMTHVFYNDGSNKQGYLGTFSSGSAGNGSATGTSTTVSEVATWQTLGGGIRTTAYRTPPADAPVISPAPLVEPGEATYYWGYNDMTNIVSVGIQLANNAPRLLAPAINETTFSGLTDGVDYPCFIFSISADDFSGIVEYRTIQTGTIPGMPQNLIATQHGADELDLTWDEPLSNGGSNIKWYLLFTEPDPITGLYEIAFPFEGYKRASRTPQFPAGTYTLYFKAINDAGHGDPISVGTYTFPNP